MPQPRRRLSWHCAAFAAAVLTFASPASDAAESPASVKNTDHLIASGNLKAAEIELRNAIQESPQDPLLRSQLARVYLQLGDPISAEREARAARDRNGKEADYLPALLQSMVQQGKFADLADLVKPGNRPPPLESKVRLALGIAAGALHDRTKAESMLTDAVRLDPSALAPKITLARTLGATNPAEANKLLDQALAVDPRSVEALQVKGELARAHGDAKAAMSQFDAALKIEPKNAAVLLSRASLNIAEGNYKAADEDLNPVLKANPDNFMANYLHAFELTKQQKYVVADHLLDRLSPFFYKVPGWLLPAGSNNAGSRTICPGGKRPRVIPDPSSRGCQGGSTRRRCRSAAGRSDTGNRISQIVCRQIAPGSPAADVAGQCLYGERQA